jgi:hypothetical protein
MFGTGRIDGRTGLDPVNVISETLRMWEINQKGRGPKKWCEDGSPDPSGDPGNRRTHGSGEPCSHKKWCEDGSPDPSVIQGRGKAYLREDLGNRPIVRGTGGLKIV